jgi:hypothetical protein
MQLAKSSCNNILDIPNLDWLRLARRDRPGSLTFYWRMLPYEQIQNMRFDRWIQFDSRKDKLKDIR